MDLSLLDKLKEKLTHGKDFGAAWEYFMDNFGEKPEFLNLGQPARNDLVEQILSQIAVQLFARETPARELMLIHLPEKSFFHGGVVLGNKMANLFYFDDVQVGLLAVVWSLSPSETKLIRFSPRPAVKSIGVGVGNRLQGVGVRW